MKLDEKSTLLFCKVGALKSLEIEKIIHCHMGHTIRMFQSIHSS